MLTAILASLAFVCMSARILLKHGQSSILSYVIGKSGGHVWARLLLKPGLGGFGENLQKK